MCLFGTNTQYIFEFTLFSLNATNRSGVNSDIVLHERRRRRTAAADMARSRLGSGTRGADRSLLTASTPPRTHTQTRRKTALARRRRSAHRPSTARLSQTTNNTGKIAALSLLPRPSLWRRVRSVRGRPARREARHHAAPAGSPTAHIHQQQNRVARVACVAPRSNI